MIACFVAIVAGGCTSSEARAPTAGRDERGARDGVVVGSFNFPESRLVAEIYAAALEHAGVPVRRELDLGPRELVEPALVQGHVDVVPEYLGTALASVAPGSAAPPADVDAAVAALADAVAGRGLQPLEAAPAQNQNAVVVRRDTALRRGLATTSDLAADAGSLRLGGPPECPQRPYCLVGLSDRYGLRFAAFVPLDGETRVARALDEDVIDVGIMFTTDGQLAERKLVMLEDDRHLQPPENVVPVVRRDALRRYPALEPALNEVSARLTTTALRFLNWRVSVAGRDARTEAAAWLVRQGLADR